MNKAKRIGAATNTTSPMLNEMPLELNPNAFPGILLSVIQKGVGCSAEVCAAAISCYDRSTRTCSVST